MATITVRTDDIDGTPDARQVDFALDGTAYAIDLAPDNEQQLRDALAPYLDAARRISPARPSSTRSRRRASTPEAIQRREIREWAIAEGHMTESARGRMPAHVVDLWHETHA
jgi:hypothetical protein